MFEKLNTGAGAHMCSVRKVFSEILQNSQENTCARVSFLIKFQAEDFAKFLRTAFLTEHDWEFASVNKIN